MYSIDMRLLSYNGTNIVLNIQFGTRQSWWLAKEIFNFENKMYLDHWRGVIEENNAHIAAGNITLDENTHPDLQPIYISWYGGIYVI